MVAALGAVSAWPVALGIAAGIAFVTTLSAISMQTAIQMELEDDMRGRVMSLWAVVVAGGASIGAGALGIAADIIGFQETLVFAGLVASAGLGLYLVAIRLRG